LQKCRLAQTEQGSFVVRIVVPVPPALSRTLVEADGQDEIPQDEPYERRATLYLMSGLQTIESAIVAGRPENILRGVRQGVSANLCDALVAMAPAHPQATLKVSMIWSRARPRVPRWLRAEVSLAQGHFAVIGEASRQLRDGGEGRRQRVSGLVIGLRAEPPRLLNPLEGRVLIRAEVEGRSSRVCFVLGQADYVRACDAHRDRSRITVTGVLQRDARSGMFELLQPRDFQVLLAETAAS
jgi:hypothetical protein